MERSKFLLFIFFCCLGGIAFLRLGLGEAVALPGSSICFSCDSCLASGCPTSHPEDPACAAFIASACERSGSESSSGSPPPPPPPPTSSSYCGNGVCDAGEDSSSCSTDCKSGSSQTETQSSWIRHIWKFIDGDASSYILRRTDQEYLNYIASVDIQCAKIPKDEFVWMPGAGNDQNWQEFGIPDCSRTTSTEKSVNVERQVEVLEKNASITGTIKDQKDNVVIGVDIHVSATSKRGGWQEALVDKNTGQYTLRVAADTWYLRVSGGESNVEIVVREGDRIFKDLVISRAESTITGQVIDPAGKGVAYAFVGVSETSFAGVDTAMETEGFRDPLVAGTDTDSQGMYRVAVPSGTYFVKTFVHPERGFMNAREQSISIGEKETKILNLQLRRSDVAIEGKVLLQDKSISDAFVWAWSKEGGYQESPSRSDGSFRLQVTRSSIWIVAASHESDEVFYKSSEVAIEVGETNVLQNIHLDKVGSLPDSATKTVDATKLTVVESTGGASVIAPANAVSNTGFVSISVTPDTRIPSQGEVRVVGVAYDLEARDATGQMISSFNSEVTVIIPYSEQELIAFGTTEDSLVMSFWDEAVGTWKTVENSVVNKEENTVNAAVDHFTRFAIIAAADTNPPTEPIFVRVVALGNGQIRLAWQNPLLDFSHAKVYRSQKAGALGEIVAAQVFTNAVTDRSNIIDGTFYYYTVRTVDAAGNESPNTDQVAIRAIGTSLGETGLTLPPGQAQENAFVRNLSQGSRGPDVKTLQQFLNAHGFLVSIRGPGSPGNETEFFGPLTSQAVIRFQEAYAAEILTPLGLSKGTGFFGSYSKAKMKELIN